jgi:hypothetical protein
MHMAVEHCQSNFYQWYARFHEGREGMTVEAAGGRPPTAHSNEKN